MKLFLILICVIYSTLCIKANQDFQTVKATDNSLKIVDTKVKEISDIIKKLTAQKLGNKGFLLLSDITVYYKFMRSHPSFSSWVPYGTIDDGNFNL
jgi:hypothetical protein